MQITVNFQIALAKFSKIKLEMFDLEQDCTSKKLLLNSLANYIIISNDKFSNFHDDLTQMIFCVVLAVVPLQSLSLGKNT